jgi:hypothetical protein
MLAGTLLEHRVLVQVGTNHGLIPTLMQPCHQSGTNAIVALTALFQPS